MCHEYAKYQQIKSILPMSAFFAKACKFARKIIICKKKLNLAVIKRSIIGDYQ